MRFGILSCSLVLTFVAVHSVCADSVENTSIAKYLLIDVSTGSNSDRYPVKELNKLPDELLTDSRYKTKWIVLKRIPRGSFEMGSPEKELGRDDDEARHRVVLTKPFYIGVMEITQSQYKKVMGDNPAYIKGDKLPVGNVSWVQVRGGKWPAEGKRPDDESFVGKLRKRTGLTVDLPTEAQWEYACRAGTNTPFYNGKNITNIWKCKNIEGLARIWETQFYNNKCNYFAEVCSYEPNAWGLYDMIGNVWEWCRDVYSSYPSEQVTDPEGGQTGRVRVIRGGGWDSAPAFCRSACRACRGQSESYMEVGFRITIEP